MSISSDIVKTVKDHLLNQPYEITCSVCGNNLHVYFVKIDSYGDLYIKTDPCEHCLEEAKG